MSISFSSFRVFLNESINKRVGKEIGGSTYLHINYVKNHPRIPESEYEKSLSILKEKHPDHKFNIVRYGYAGVDKGSFSFINSPDFDSNPEPIVSDVIRVNADGSTKITKEKKDPQIYHHKHEFVGSDYKGFDIEKSKRRSETYNQIIDKLKKTNPKIRSRMGTKSVWDNEVIPHIKNHIEESKKFL